MVTIPALWLPILVSAVGVFVASSLIHMVLKYHNTDYRKLPNEDGVLGAMRTQSLAPGVYVFPHHAGGSAAMSSPEMVEKYKRGPVGILTLIPSAPPAMPKYLTQWFVYSVVVSVFVAYVASRTLSPGAPYLSVFRIAGTVAFLAYAGEEAVNSIWRGQPWSVTLKNSIDGLVYALLTAGVFGWLWP